MADNSPKPTQDQDLHAPNPPSDSISSIACNGTISTPTTALIAGSWDNTLSFYELQYHPNGAFSQIVKHNQITHEAPVLCCDFASDGFTTFSAGCDGYVRMWDLRQQPPPAPAGQPTPTNTGVVNYIGKHDQPVRCLKVMNAESIGTANPLCVTGSWDKTVKFWDIKQRNGVPACELKHEERIYAMDVKGSITVVATADNRIHIYDKNQKIGAYKSPLNYQSRCVSIFSDLKGFAIGCIEGRVAIQYFDEIQLEIAKEQNRGARNDKSKNFVFKCHREKTDVFCVNAIDFHRYNTFCTAGSDGVFSWWDKDMKHRLAIFEKFKKKEVNGVQMPITSVKFNPMGNLMFYSLSYDWSKGAEHNNPNIGQHIMVHPITDKLIQPKQQASAGGGVFSRR